MELILSHCVPISEILLHEIHWINSFNLIATEYPVPEVPVVQGYISVLDIVIIRFSHMHGAWHCCSADHGRNWPNLFPLDTIDVTG